MCYVNLCPHHKYSYYIYVSQQEYPHRLLFFDKKIKLGTILVDKSEKYLYNEVKTLREITQYPPLSPYTSVSNPFGIPRWGLFLPRSRGIPLHVGCIPAGAPLHVGFIPISVTPQIQNCCRDCIAYAGGVGWPLRPRIVTFLSFPIGDAVAHPSNNRPE